MQRWRLTQGARTTYAAINSVLCANNGDVLRAAAIKGQGVALLPTFLVGPDIKARRLKCVLGDCSPTELGVYALYAPNRYLAAKTRLFIDFLIARFGDAPDWDNF